MNIQIALVNLLFDANFDSHFASGTITDEQKTVSSRHHVSSCSLIDDGQIIDRDIPWFYYQRFRSSTSVPIIIPVSTRLSNE
jgi:hypothetical protein